MLARRRRRRANIKTTFCQSLVFAGRVIYPNRTDTLKQCWLNVGFVSQTVGQR